MRRCVARRYCGTPDEGRVDRLRRCVDIRNEPSKPSVLEDVLDFRDVTTDNDMVLLTRLDDGGRRGLAPRATSSSNHALFSVTSRPSKGIPR